MREEQISGWEVGKTNGIKMLSRGNCLRSLHMMSNSYNRIMIEDECKCVSGIIISFAN